MTCLGDRIDALRSTADPTCMQLIDELIGRLRIAQKGTADVCGEAIMAGLPLSKMGRMLDIGWRAVVESDLEF